MTIEEINERIRISEHDGEKLISNVRLIMGGIFVLSTTGVAAIRALQGDPWIPWRAHVVTGLLLAYAIYLFVYVRRTERLADGFKYVCTTIDMTLISAIIWVSCTYPELSPPLPFLSFRALFYPILIAAGSCRYSSRCAYFSGIYAAFTYLVVIVANRGVLDLPHTFELYGREIEVNFPLYYEAFRLFGMIIIGTVTGMSSSRRLKLFYAMLDSETALRREMDETNKAHLARTVEKNERLNGVVVESFDAMENISRHIDAMETKVQSQMKSARGASESADGIFEQTNSFREKVSAQTDSIEESSRSVERMVLNVGSIRATAQGTKGEAEALMKSSAAGQKALVELAGDLRRMEEQSANLHAANKAIADIAGQTNILAMNAAIEAARAGDAGKGFAVVAGEVRKLAELSVKESQTISAEILKMEKGMGQIGEASRATVDSMDGIFSGIRDMTASFAEMGRAVEEQVREGAGVLDALKTVQRTSREVQEGSGRIHERSAFIHGKMSEQEAISEELTQAAHAMRASERHVLQFLEKAKEMASLRQT